ncbi:MAG TPA: hypothetical protein PKC43_04125 [Phycisphaerales bacterium]|nr:hypothetical protein [Phycisphaerales bacterium]HMP36614.1 hypothetical protein [Phycisphaerales bacterium]
MSTEGPRLVVVGSLSISGSATKQVFVWNGSQWTGWIFSMGGAGSAFWDAGSLPGGSLVLAGSFRNFLAGPVQPVGTGSVFSKNLGLLLSSDTPWITAISDDRVVREGSPFAVEAQWARLANGTPPAVTWLRDERVILEERAPTEELTSTLTVSTAGSDAAGRYRIELADECGTVRSAEVIVTVTCAEDVNLDGAVDALDLGRLLAAWGGADPDADLDRDGVVGPADMALLIAAWGPCGG